MNVSPCVKLYILIAKQVQIFVMVLLFFYLASDHGMQDNAIWGVRNLVLKDNGKHPLHGLHVVH